MTVVASALYQQDVGGRSKILRNKMIVRVVGLCMLLCVFALAFVWSRMQVLQLRYELTGAQKNVEDVQQQINRMELAVAALKAPERLEKIGKEELGLKLPDPGQIVFVQEH